MTQANPSDGLTLASAYAACRDIARREAKNFYYAFIALPTPRRNAICAIYAFMRRADDLADDESISRDERRRSLEAWLAEWRCSLPGRLLRPIPFFLPCVIAPCALGFRSLCWMS